MRVATVGSFAEFGIRQVRLLMACRTFAGLEGEVVVVLDPEPIVTRSDREERVMSCRYVSAVLVAPGDVVQIVRRTLPDVLVVERDEEPIYRNMVIGEPPLPAEEWLEEEGVQIAYVP